MRPQCGQSTLRPACSSSVFNFRPHDGQKNRDSIVRFQPALLFLRWCRKPGSLVKPKTAAALLLNRSSTRGTLTPLGSRTQYQPKKVLLICSHLQQFSEIISAPNAPCVRSNNVNGMRNSGPINHFPPTLFSLNRSPIYGETYLFSQRATRSPKSKVQSPKWGGLGALAGRAVASAAAPAFL
jgi:hypothetical protein